MGFSLIYRNNHNVFNLSYSLRVCKSEKHTKTNIMKAQTILTFLALSILPQLASAGRPQSNEEYAKHVFVDSMTNTTLPYRMLSPESIHSGEKYPLVLFLHGSGERGNDNEKQLTYGASTFSNPANVDKYPAFVVFPQCKDKTWTERFTPQSFMPGAPTPEISKLEEALIALVENLEVSYPIDTNRVYVVGLSMGGIATYDLVCRYPEKFAAAVPICGAINPERLDSAKDVSFLIFHGEEDEQIPSLCSREAYKSLNAAGAKVDYVEFAGMGHECWSAAFNYPSFLPWLFSQTKSFVPAGYGTTLTYLE